MTAAEQMVGYWQGQLTRGRLLGIRDESGELIAVCSFFVAADMADAERIHRTKQWSTLTDTPEGTVLYIDWLVGQGFTRELLRAMDAAFARKIPTWQTAIWYRPRQIGEKRYTYARRSV